jgi:threonine dehydrogenase-like Zn-dependent dehydrogenase
VKAVRIDGPRAASLVDKPQPTIDGDYALIKVHVAPMCNEYIAYKDGVYLERNRPDSLGHEMAGEVVATPRGASAQVGDRVVALCGFPCGDCVLCQRGFYAHCNQTDDPRAVCGSESGECSFAQYAVKPDWMLVPIPDGLSYEHASMACCGLGPSFGAMQRAQVDAFSTVLVTGLGAVGLGGVVNARFRGARVIGVTRSPYRSKLALALGCDTVLDPSVDDVPAAVAELTVGRGVDFALECSGQPSYQRLLVDCVGRLGTVAFLAEPGELALNVDADLVQRGVTLFGSLDINRADVSRLLQMIAAIPDTIETFITHRYPMAQVGVAFEHQISRECGKVILYPWRD